MERDVIFCGVAPIPLTLHFGSSAIGCIYQADKSCKRMLLLPLGLLITVHSETLMYFGDPLGMDSTSVLPLNFNM